ncbi:MAG: heparan-alpha-glucosaminide N-acetyltransferase domain-containing protein [Gemmatimonadaceae bacterium]
MTSHTSKSTTFVSVPLTQTYTDHVRKAVTGAAQSVQRLETIDLFRGLIMVIMLIDHTRDFVHRDGMGTDPMALATTTPILYFTRWITHFCAPGFVLLAGVSAGIQRQRGATIPALSKFLWSRGLVLIFMEVVVIRLIVQTNFASNFVGNLQVIWAIGVSMIALAALIHLPKRIVFLIGLAIVFGHNFLDRFTVPVWTGRAAPAPTVWGKIWMLVHQGGHFPIGDSHSAIVKAAYPVLPWIGVIAVGYAFADLWSWDAERRRRTLRILAFAMIAVFFALRIGNVYGDNQPWLVQDTFFKSFASFMNVQKYPPSLQYLLATLAPSFLLLSWLEGRNFKSTISRALITYGRVPMFYYLLQWTWARVSGMIVTAAAGLPIDQYFRSRAATFLGAPPQVFGGTLVHVYVVWALGVFVLYFPCRWYADVKARRKDLVLLRYL